MRTATQSAGASIAQVLAYLNADISAGAEFPDACPRVARRYGVSLDELTAAYDSQEFAPPPPLTPAEIKDADQLTRAHSAFDGFSELLDAAGHYRPSLHAGPRNTDEQERQQLARLADLYDQAQAAAGDCRRAFRY
jgi:hypothetical protein